jgi:predicted acylesterase/phospholipase RssA
MSSISAGNLSGFLHYFCNDKKPFRVEKISYIRDDFSVATVDRFKTFCHLGGRRSNQEVAKKMIAFVNSQHVRLQQAFQGEKGRVRYNAFQTNFGNILRESRYQLTDKDRKRLERIRPREDDKLLQLDREIEKCRSALLGGNLQAESQLVQFQAQREVMIGDPLLSINERYKRSFEAFQSLERSKSEKDVSENSSVEKIVLDEIQRNSDHTGPLVNVRNIVISGGGAKGAVLPAAFRTFLKYAPKLMENIENLFGTSVGALTAALIATGISQDTLKYLAGVDFSTLLGKRLILKDGGNLVLFVRQCIRMNILDQLSKTSSEKRKKFEETKPEMAQSIKEQLKCPLEESKITFQMLSYLNRIDSKCFKNLTVTSTKKEGGQFIFSTETTPDADIAIAVRASASIPVVFKPVTIQTEEGPVTLFDGGMIDNVPVALVEQKVNNAPDQTLVIVFEEELKGDEISLFHESSERAPYVPGIKDWLMRDVVPSMATGLRLETPNVQTKANVLNHVKEHYTYILSFSVDLKTVQFKQGAENPGKYTQIGKQTTKEFLKNWRGD